MELTNRELKNIKGGALSAAFLNALARASATILDIGRSIGSSIRRAFTKNFCWGRISSASLLFMKNNNRNRKK